MTRQNVYDDDAFFTGYRRLREEGRGLNAAVEEPAMRSVTPDLAGRTVVDLGCGDGRGCLQAAQAQALSVLGVDPSERMLELARQRSAHPAITYVRSFAEDLELTPGSVDVVVSSLALHYVEDLEAVVARIADWLRPCGVLVFSMEHPVVTAAPAGLADGGWLLSNYFDEGHRHTRWFVDDVVKYHRTVASIAAAVLGAGLRITALLEPQPSREDVERDPHLAVHRGRPSLLVMRCEKADRGVSPSPVQPDRPTAATDP